MCSCNNTAEAPIGTPIGTPTSRLATGADLSLEFMTPRPSSHYSPSMGVLDFSDNYRFGTPNSQFSILNSQLKRSAAP